MREIPIAPADEVYRGFAESVVALAIFFQIPREPLDEMDTLLQMPLVHGPQTNLGLAGDDLLPSQRMRYKRSELLAWLNRNRA